LSTLWRWLGYPKIVDGIPMYAKILDFWIYYSPFSIPWSHRHGKRQGHCLCWKCDPEFARSYAKEEGWGEAITFSIMGIVALILVIAMVIMVMGGIVALIIHLSSAK
jgi:hypothetical protein